VLDVMLPGQDGLATCRALREAGVWSPVLILTPGDAVESRIEGLDSGADDYLVKPFSFAELLVRLRALGRRVPAARPAVLQVGDLRLDPGSHRAWRGEAELELSSKEFALLESFMRRPGQALSRLQLLESAWDLGYESRFESRGRLRELLAAEDRPALRTPRARDSARRRVPAAGGRRMSRLPIRLRLTLAFTIVMAVVLAAMSFFVYARVDNALLSSLDQSLRSQTVDVSRADPRSGPSRQRSWWPSRSSRATRPLTWPRTCF
jgi:hypothetical protein